MHGLLCVQVYSISGYPCNVGIIIFMLYILFILSIECLQPKSFGTDIITFSVHTYPGG